MGVVVGKGAEEIHKILKNCLSSVDRAISSDLNIDCILMVLVLLLFEHLAHSMLLPKPEGLL